MPAKAETVRYGKKETTFFSVSPKESGLEWVGLINFPASRGEPYRISLARPVAGAALKKALSYFHDNSFDAFGPVIDGYLGLQKRASAFFCRKTFYCPIGGSGTGYERQRELYRGEFECLLEGAWSEQGNADLFGSIEITHDGIASALRHNFDFSEDIATKPVTSFCFSKEVSIFCEEVGGRKLSDIERTQTRKLVLRIVNQKPKSGVQWSHVYLPLHQFLDLLNDRAFKPRTATLGAGERPGFPPAKLYWSGIKWHYDTRRSSRCIELTPSDFIKCLSFLLSKEKVFLAHDLGVLHRMRFENYFIEDMLYWYLPTLERQLRRNYLNGPETSYLDKKERFFRYLDQSGDQGITDFLNKHVKLVDEKKPGLKQLLERAIDDLNSSGVQLPEATSKAIVEVRNQIMHGDFNSDKLLLCPLKTGSFEAGVFR